MADNESVNDGSVIVDAAENNANSNTGIINKADEPVIIPEQTEPVKEPARFSKTAVFSPAEFKYVGKVFKARNESGLTADYNHFIRQCVDFAINSNPGSNLTFARPDIPFEFLKNGFFKPVN